MLPNYTEKYLATLTVQFSGYTYTWVLKLKFFDYISLFPAL